MAFAISTRFLCYLVEKPTHSESKALSRIPVFDPYGSSHFEVTVTWNLARRLGTSDSLSVGYMYPKRWQSAVDLDHREVPLFLATITFLSSGHASRLFLVTVNFLVPCFENMRKLKQNTVNMIWRKFRSNQCIGFNFTDGQNSIQVDSNALLLKQPEFSGSSLLVHQTSRIPNVRTGPLGIENLLEFGTPWILNTLVCLSSSLEICSWKLNFQVQVVSGLGDWKSWTGNANELASYRSGDYGRTSLPSSTLTFPNKVMWRHERPK